jgi:hypothetical protein
MYSAAAAWLMTELTTDPLLVSLVQVATSLPMCLFAVVAGALTDIVDKSSICGNTGASPRPTRSCRTARTAISSKRLSRLACRGLIVPSLRTAAFV